MRLTIVMTYWNRKAQLQNTLRSIAQYGHDINIIIVDDCSTDGQDITCFEADKISVITLKNKTWVNPCIPFNIGFSLVNSDIVLIQNAECMHIGDIIGHALANCKKGTYISYGAFAIKQHLNEPLSQAKDVESFIKPYMDSTIVENSNSAWYTHQVYRPAAFHFCAAITKQDLYELGGFDERFANGSGYDDNDFIDRIRKKRMRVEIVHPPFVIHQWHEPFYCGEVQKMMYINYEIFDASRKSGIYDVKPYNKIFK
jgi:glycosyltransferase involved in cell wall biosynthesis